VSGRSKVRGFWSDDFRGAELPMYPKAISVDGWPAVAFGLGRVRTCEDCGRVVTHVGYALVIDVEKPGWLDRAKPLCLADAMRAESRGAGRSEKGMLDAAEATDWR